MRKRLGASRVVEMDALEAFNSDVRGSELQCMVADAESSPGAPGSRNRKDRECCGMLQCMRSDRTAKMD